MALADSTLKQPLTQSSIHKAWMTAVSLPPTTRLSSLRHLLRITTTTLIPTSSRSVSSSSPASTTTISLSPESLARLYLDLALTYAFLGEYYQASLSFQEAATSDPSNAFAYFGLGLARAELQEWQSAERNWERCLNCFDQARSGDPPIERLESVTYKLYEHVVDDSYLFNGGLGNSWNLERQKVEWNLNVARLKSRAQGTTPDQDSEREKAPGWHGIPAGLTFGPDWQEPERLSLSSLTDASPASSVVELSRRREAGNIVGEAKYFQPLLDIGKVYTALDIMKTYQLSQPESRVADVPSTLSSTTIKGMSTKRAQKLRISPKGLGAQNRIVQTYRMRPKDNKDQDAAAQLNTALTWPAAGSDDIKTPLPISKPSRTWPTQRRDSVTPSYRRESLIAKLLTKALPPIPVSPGTTDSALVAPVITPPSSSSTIAMTSGRSDWGDSPTLGRDPFPAPLFLPVRTSSLDHGGSAVGMDVGGTPSTSQTNTTLPPFVISPFIMPSPLGLYMEMTGEEDVESSEEVGTADDTAVVNDEEQWFGKALMELEKQKRADDDDVDGKNKATMIWEDIKREANYDEWDANDSDLERGEFTEETREEEDLEGEILLPRTFEGFGSKTSPTDWNAKYGDFPGKRFMD